jgi:hypothetical protein
MHHGRDSIAETTSESASVVYDRRAQLRCSMEIRLGRSRSVWAYSKWARRGDPQRNNIPLVITAHSLVRVMWAMLRRGTVWDDKLALAKRDLIRITSHIITQNTEKGLTSGSRGRPRSHPEVRRGASRRRGIEWERPHTVSWRSAIADDAEWLSGKSRNRLAPSIRVRRKWR